MVQTRRGTDTTTPSAKRNSTDTLKAAAQRRERTRRVKIEAPIFVDHVEIESNDDEEQDKREEKLDDDDGNVENDDHDDDDNVENDDDDDNVENDDDDDDDDNVENDDDDDDNVENDDDDDNVENDDDDDDDNNVENDDDAKNDDDDDDVANVEDDDDDDESEDDNEDVEYEIGKHSITDKKMDKIKKDEEYTDSEISDGDSIVNVADASVVAETIKNVDNSVSEKTQNDNLSKDTFEDCNELSEPKLDTAIEEGINNEDNEHNVGFKTREEDDVGAGALFGLALASQIEPGLVADRSLFPIVEESTPIIINPESDEAIAEAERDLSMSASLPQIGIATESIFSRDASGIVRVASAITKQYDAATGALSDVTCCTNAPPLDPHKEARRLRKLASKKEPTTAGADWFGMGAPELTFEMRNDLRLIRNRAYIDPKRHYKREKINGWPKFFQVGTVVEGAQDFYSSRINKRKRQQSFAGELLADQQTNVYMKRKFAEIQAEKPSKKRLKRKRKVQP